jgi:hypothetical protein
VADDHSAEFLAFRDLLLTGLSDEDRRRLAGLFGCMTERLPELSPEADAALRAFVALKVADRRRVVRWFASYVSRWGQVPVAASRRVAAPKAGSNTNVTDRTPKRP